MEQQQVPARPMGCAPATQTLREEHRRAHEQMVDAMTCPRYFALIDSLQAIVDDPPWSPHASRSARKVLPKAVAKDWRRVCKAADAARTAVPDERDERLHDVRKAAKRARYAAEAIEPIVGKDAARFARLMTELQDSLGEHHDTVVARHKVVELADPAFGSAIDARDCEVLLSRLADAGREAYESYQAALDRAARPKHHRWLR
jgi:CHAD domain-containing protein